MLFAEDDCLMWLLMVLMKVFLVNQTIVVKSGKTQRSERWWKEGISLKQYFRMDSSPLVDTFEITLFI